ncbi:MAG: MSCRAMM family protein [Acidobacteriota bacterium]
MRPLSAVALLLFLGCWPTDVLAALPAAPGQAGATSPGQPSPTSQRTPVRGVRPGEEPEQGTAILRGYVVAADTGSPLRRAMVRATSQDGRGGGLTTTDAQGRFEIAGLAAGRYSLSVSKAGYVTMAYGQRRADQQGTTLEILDRQVVEKIAFSLPRGGVIAGTVTDEFGDPIAGAQVSALRYRYVNGARRLQSSGTATTDDQGSFRVFGLAPGTYYVSGAMRVPTLSMPGVSTTVVEGYAPTYYPGTPNAADAQRVAVKVAQETTGVSFPLAATRLARVSGRAVSSTGEPVAQGFISVVPLASSAGSFTMFSGGLTRADGSFQIGGLAAGTYNVSLRPRNPSDPNNEFGLVRITVGGDDLDNVLIVMSRGAIVRGTITTDENTPPPVRPQQANIFAQPAEPEVMAIGGNSRVHDDWTFEITGLTDRRVISASLAESPDWVLKAVYHHGVDITDTPVEFVPGQILEGLQVVLSRKRTELSGRILGGRDRADTEATVIVFAEDPARWIYASRFLRTARPDQDGRYVLRGMPPHDYFVVAVRDLEPGRWQDPEFLEIIRDHAARVSLGEGETKVQDLKVVAQ